MARDTIFIGHATPEDNEFTLWLQAKLINEGYKCECDLSFLLGGEADYWKNLQDFLTNNTAKYILVISENTFKKQGVLDEWEHCRSIERELGINDFIIPVKIDDSPYNARIGLNRRNIIPFEGFWANGLKRLFKKLENDNIERVAPNSLSLDDWYKNVYTNWSGIEKDKEDYYYSNWVEINNYPAQVYFYKFKNEKQANAVLDNNIIYPAIRHGNTIVTFQKKLDYFLKKINDEGVPDEIISKRVSDAFEYYEDDGFPTYSDYRRLLVRLLKTCFESHLQANELLHYELANKTKCFYFSCDAGKHQKGRFYIHDKPKNIAVTGKYYDAFWHYGISIKLLFYPHFCFSIKNHVVFTDDGKLAWENKRKMHSARRNKGKNMRNKEWRDCLLSFLASIGNEVGKIGINVNETDNIELDTIPIMFKSNFSYIEPNDEERLVSIDSFIDEEDFYLDENTTEDE